MTSSLVLVLLLFLESTIGSAPFQQCCPEDDKHLFIESSKICSASKTLGLACNNNSDVYSFMKHDNYWFIDSDVVMGSEFIGFVVPHGSFCLANLTQSHDDWKKQQYDGIVLCKETRPSKTYLGAEPLSYAVCLLISGIGCFLTFLTYILVPALRKELFNKCLINTLLCFVFAYFMMGINLMELHWMHGTYCLYILYFTLFWCLAAFLWTNVVSFHMWRTIVFERFPINEARLSKVYYFWGWGIPLILSCIATVMETVPIGIGTFFSFCPINSTYALGALMLPYPFLFFFNFIYFIWIICKLWWQEVPNSSDLQLSRFQRLQHKCFMHLKLFILMGVPWIIFFVVRELPGRSFIWILFNIFTALQGLFFFLLLVVFQKKALLGLAEQLCPCPSFTANAPVLLNEEDNENYSKMESQKDAKQIEAEA